MGHHYWLIVTFTWIGSASLQYINTDGHNSDENNLDRILNNPLPNDDLIQFPSSIREPVLSDSILRNLLLLVPINKNSNDLHPYSEYESTDTVFLPNAQETSPPKFPDEVHNNQRSSVENHTGSNFNDRSNQKNKRSFSPWGGKRNGKTIHNSLWTWKRAIQMREPSMPKRVRFSPWGGKRGSHLLYKPGVKSKIIFSSTFPELPRIISYYSPRGGMVSNIDRHANKIITLNTKLDEKLIKQALPFKTYIEQAKFFKLGHPYINLKTDTKRKMKFNAWDGKRAPPIIGPIWSPSFQNLTDETLDTILVFSEGKGDNFKLTNAL